MVFINQQSNQSRVDEWVLYRTSFHGDEMNQRNHITFGVPYHLVSSPRSNHQTFGGAAPNVMWLNVG